MAANNDFFQSEAYLKARAKAEAERASQCPHCLNFNRELWASQCQHPDIYPPCEKEYKVETSKIIFNHVAQAYLIIILGMLGAISIILYTSWKFY